MHRMLISLLLMLVSCRQPSSVQDAELVTSFRFSPSAFDSFRRNTELKYSLNRPASVSAYIVRRDGNSGESIIKTLALELSDTKGSHAITWIGDTDQRLFAPSGIYYGLLVIEGYRYEAIVQVFHF